MGLRVFGSAGAQRTHLHSDWLAGPSERLLLAEGEVPRACSGQLLSTNAARGLAHRRRTEGGIRHSGFRLSSREPYSPSWAGAAAASCRPPRPGPRRTGGRDGAVWGGPRAGEQVTRRHLELLFTSQGLGLENNNKTACVTFRAPGGGQEERSKRCPMTRSQDEGTLPRFCTS